MIKILGDLKKKDRKQYAKVLKQLDNYGQRSSKGYFNRYSFPQYLDMISFADTYSMQPDQYDMVMDVLGELNPTENENMKLIRSAKPKEYKAIQKRLATQTARTREYILSYLQKDEDEPKPTTFIQSLAKFKDKVLG